VSKQGALCGCTAPPASFRSAFLFGEQLLFSPRNPLSLGSRGGPLVFDCNGRNEFALQKFSASLRICGQSPSLVVASSISFAAPPLTIGLAYAGLRWGPLPAGSLRSCSAALYAAMSSGVRVEAFAPPGWFAWYTAVAPVPSTPPEKPPMAAVLASSLHEKAASCSAPSLLASAAAVPAD